MQFEYRVALDFKEIADRCEEFQLEWYGLTFLACAGFALTHCEIGCAC